MPVSHSPFISASALQALPRNGFTSVKVLVIGDLMLDQYVDGEVQRISPEAPVPVLSVQKRRAVPGGAANVAMNIGGLNAEVITGGVVGRDAAGERILELLSESGAGLECVITIPSRPTTCKTRVICGNHQIVRLDEEVSDRLDDKHERELIDRVASCLRRGDIDAVILSDYGKGVLSQSCPQVIIENCRRYGIPVLVDPKRQDYTAYKGAACITPNQKEFFSAVTAVGMHRDDFNFAGFAFREQLDCTALVVTQGAGGMTLFTAGQAHHVPALAEEVFDVSGAGDTVIATLGAAVGQGLSFQHAVEIANAATSIVVRRAGTTPVSWRDLSELLGMDAALSLGEERIAAATY